MLKNPRDLESWVNDVEDPAQFSQAIQQLVNEKDPVTFQELFFYVPGPHGMIPYEAYKYQAEISRDPSTKILINKSRQIGMSVSTLLDHLHRGLFNPVYKCSAVSATLLTASELISKLREIILAVPEEFQIPIYSDQNNLIQLANGKEGGRGAKFQAFAAKENSTRSYSADLIMDEHSSIPNAEMVMRGAMATTVREGYRIRVLSTPRGNLNLFGQMVLAARAVRDNKATKAQELLAEGWSYYEVPWWECGHTIDGQWVPDLDEKRIRSLCINEEMYQQEFCCNIVDESTSMLSYELLTKYTDPELKQFSLYNAVDQHHSNTYFIGVDPASQINEAGFVISERTKENHWNIRYVNAEPMANTPLAQFTTKWYNHVRPLKIYVDKNNIGLPFCQELSRMVGGMHVVDVPLSAQSKEWLVYNMVGMFESGSLTIPKNDKLFNQLHALEQDNSVLKGVKTFTGKVKSDQDDLIWATALSLAHNYLTPTIARPQLIQPLKVFNIRKVPTYNRNGYGRDN